MTKIAVDDVDFVPLNMRDEKVIQMVEDDDVDVVEDAGVDASAMVDEGVSMVGGSKNMSVDVASADAAEEEDVEVEDALDDADETVDVALVVV